MDKNAYIDKINKLKPYIGMWDINLGIPSDSDFVVGYYYNESTKMYDVYINNERGRQHIRLSTDDEIKALEKLLSIVEFEAKLNNSF